MEKLDDLLGWYIEIGGQCTGTHCNNFILYK